MIRMPAAASRRAVARPMPRKASSASSKSARPNSPENNGPALCLAQSAAGRGQPSLPDQRARNTGSISFSDLRPKFLVRSISASVF